MMIKISLPGSRKLIQQTVQIWNTEVDKCMAMDMCHHNFSPEERNDYWNFHLLAESHTPTIHSFTGPKGEGSCRNNSKPCSKSSANSNSATATTTGHIRSCDSRTDAINAVTVGGKDAGAKD
jgi:hypothetical protein